jgi:hypothetical protein
MGFFQIKMDPESAHLTASTGPRGSFQYKRMAMGLKESPITFMKAMDLAIAGLSRDEMEIYLDDIMVFSEILKEHIIRLERVLRKLAEVNLTIEPKKCQFLKHEARILGHIAGNKEIKMNTEKIKEVMEYPRVTTARKIKQFLGFTSYYRKFIEGYSKIAFPLLEILRGEKTFSWGKEQEETFEILKEKLCSAPILAAPNLSEEFIVITDASDYAIGTILSQGKIGQDKPYAYASRCLKGSELRYPTYDKELLAIVFAKEQFRHYLYGRKFTVVTDHEPLKHFNTSKHLDLRFNRLKAALRGYEFEIIYKQGKKNTNVYALSRNPIIEEGQENPERPRAELYLLANK